MLLRNAIRYIFWGIFCTSIQSSNTDSLLLPSRDLASSSSTIPDDINTTELGNPADLNWIAMLTNVTNSLPTSFGGDEDLPVDNIITAADRSSRLRRLNMLFPGIFWDKAYPDDSGESCTIEQLNILEMATRVAARLTHYSPTNLDDAAFQRYFVTDGRVSGRWSNGPNRGNYLNLINNLKQLGSYPTTGDSKGHMLQAYRIAYLCGPIPEVADRCGDALGPTKVNAYTVLGGTDGPSEYGTVIIFCPAFFSLRFTDMITSGPPKTVADLGSLELITFEQVIMHEWMHCKNPIGMAQKIIDIDKSDAQKVVYGSSRCHDRAWLNVPAGEPNTEIVLNADNYAWTWMSREFARVWEWNDDGTTDIGVIDGIIYTTADIWTNLTTPINALVNCVQNSTSIDCSYIGMSYNSYLIDQGVACKCAGAICDINSPACCANNTCSTCAAISASATDPTDVPSCCTITACLWENAASAPSSAVSAQPTRPLTGPCNCNEDGCSGDSPVCCDNGTCPS